jgi:DNA-binding NarL/FixJ family response regulator
MPPATSVDSVVSPIEEIEVASVVGLGYERDEAASALEVTEATMSTHLARVYKKMRVHGFHELAFTVTDHALWLAVRRKQPGR